MFSFLWVFVVLFGERKPRTHFIGWETGQMYGEPLQIEHSYFGLPPTKSVLIAL